MPNTMLKMKKYPADPADGDDQHQKREHSHIRVDIRIVDRDHPQHRRKHQREDHQVDKNYQQIDPDPIAEFRKERTFYFGIGRHRR